MANIVIDPVIIMIPPDDANRAMVEMWLENLTIWLKEALTAPFTWLHCQETSDLLAANGQFPNFEQLRQLQRKYRLDINISLIARNINDFFRDDTLDLATHLKSLEYVIECEQSSIIVKPEQFIARLPAYIHAGFFLLLADCCACKHINHAFGQGLHIATLALGDDTKEITTSVIILDALPDFVRPTDNTIVQTFPLLITPDELQPLIDPIEVWAKGERGITYAIEQQYKKSWVGTIGNPCKFRLGPHFIESVNRRGLDNNDIILQSIIRAASDVIADKAKDIRGYHLHPYRTSEAADSPQFTRDSDRAKAWRLMIQKHGAGWRLHYWHISAPDGNMIEFINVCKESEREID